MKPHFLLALFLIAIGAASIPSVVKADAIGDAIRQAEQAKVEAERMSSSAEEGRKAPQDLFLRPRRSLV